MNADRKEWSRQYTSNVGAREALRLGCAIIVWILLGVGISTVLELAGYHAGPVIITVFFIALFAFSVVAPMWQSAYALLRRILGNPNLPPGLMPRAAVKTSREPRVWWSYLPGLWFGLMTLIVLYFAIKYLSR